MSGANPLLSPKKRGEIFCQISTDIIKIKKVSQQIVEEDISEKLAESWSKLKVHYLAMNTTILKFLDESRRLEQKRTLF